MSAMETATTTYAGAPIAQDALTYGPPQQKARRFRRRAILGRERPINASFQARPSPPFLDTRCNAASTALLPGAWR